MKAASAVLTQSQRPQTVLGLPPKLFMLAATAAVVAVALCATAGLAPLSIPAFVGVFLGLWLVFWRRARLDHHYDRALTMAPRFWRGREHRVLASGHAPKRRQR